MSASGSRVNAAPRVTGLIAGDAEVIQRSWQEPESFGAIFDRYVTEIHSYVARRLGDDAADDIAAETFAVAFRQRERYDLSRDNARPWLYGIASRLASRHRRGEVRALRALARTGGDLGVVDHGDRIAERLNAQMLRPRLARALGGLAPGDRDVLLLVALADLRYEAIAEALDIPYGTVCSRLNRARRKIRAALGDADPTEITEEPADG